MKDEMMAPEDRDALMAKMVMKMKEMSDDDLKSLADEAGVDTDVVAPKVVDAEPIDSKPVIDTATLTGPMPALKSFLLKSQRDNDAK